MYRAGGFVAQHVTPITDDQIQPNGVDLTIDTISTQTTPGSITTTSKTIGDRTEHPHANDEYHLDPGGYILRYAETVHIPTGHVGFIYPRSSLMRNSGMLNSAVWDAGYEGKGEGLLQIHHSLRLERGARIGQLVLANADHTGTYDGSYQHEHLD